ncbi:hypothetical protein C4K16_3194 [Pseudomonas chlororaphis subsp. aurantiaca]|nr:hypothetical protein C4K17_3194 [Pseudomonas chlororaphis subsp. aurantiaca]AZD73554.1 hypothetical protein C4K16_3194 [Pseudomonas chlororaphis subsp. aurantiaca]
MKIRHSLLPLIAGTAMYRFTRSEAHPGKSDVEQRANYSRNEL